MTSEVDDVPGVDTEPMTTQACKMMEESSIEASSDSDRTAEKAEKSNKLNGDKADAADEPVETEKKKTNGEQKEGCEDKMESYEVIADKKKEVPMEEDEEKDSEDTNGEQKKGESKDEKGSVKVAEEERKDAEDVLMEESKKVVEEEKEEKVVAVKRTSRNSRAKKEAVVEKKEVAEEKEQEAVPAKRASRSFRAKEAVEQEMKKEVVPPARRGRQSKEAATPEVPVDANNKVIEEDQKEAEEKVVVAVKRASRSSGSAKATTASPAVAPVKRESRSSRAKNEAAAAAPKKTTPMSNAKDSAEETMDEDKKYSEEAVKEEKEEVPTPRRGRHSKNVATPANPIAAMPNPGSARKRKHSEDLAAHEGTSAPATPARRGGKAKKVLLSWETFASKQLGDRVLSCGAGEQLGHPGRNTTKKPRKVDIVEEECLKIRQAVAGGVHSLFLTEDHRIYSCGINDKGTVPAEGVEADGSIDEFSLIDLHKHIDNMETAHGKVVMLAAGASFSAALTDKGSVIMWGNLRKPEGDFDVHPKLHEMQEKPVIVINHSRRAIVKIVAGENHLVMLSEEGHVLTFGDGSLGQLGRTRRFATVRSKYLVDESGEQLLVHATGTGKNRFKNILFKDVFAGGFWTMAVAENGAIYACGLNNFGHLGLPIEEHKTEQLKEEEGDGEKGDQPTTDDTNYSVYELKEAGAYAGKEYTHMSGVQHVIARTKEGEVFAIGKNLDNALGLGTWTGNDDEEHWRYTSLEAVPSLPAGKVAGVAATLGASVAWTEDGKAWGWGYDTSGQLGLGIADDDEKMVSTPTQIASAHLDGYEIVGVSVADNHSMFVAKKAAK